METYYWPGCYTKVKRHCECCVRCNERRTPIPKLREQLHPIPVKGQPIYRVSIDVVGPFGLSNQGNRFIIAAIDYFSKWVEAAATPDQTAVTVANFVFDQLACRHGSPSELLSDIGPAFVSDVVRELREIMRIRKTFTLPYRPSTNGMIERFNRTLIDMLAKLIDHRNDWEMYLQPARFAYRTTVHESTGEIPFFLLHGRDPRLPSDIYEPGAVQFQHADNCVITFSGTLTEAWARAKEGIVSTQERYARYHDKYARPQTIQAHDKVALRYKPAGATLSAKWDVAYRVLEVKEPNLLIRGLDDPEAPPFKVHKGDVYKCALPHLTDLPELVTEISPDSTSTSYDADSEQSSEL